MYTDEWASSRETVATVSTSCVRRLPVAMLIILCLGAFPAAALDRMGPAASQLGQDRFSIGLDYAWSNTDLEAVGSSLYTSLSTLSGTPVITQSYREHAFKMKSVDMDRLYATFAYGIGKRSDVFFRLGGAQTDWNESGGTNLALSGGIRSTFYETGRWRVGGLAQISWTEGQYDGLPCPNPFNTQIVAMQGELSLCEIQIALAASRRLTKRVSVYGGPFLHFATGDLDLERDAPWIVWVPEGYALSLESSYDLEETTRVGGYIGAQIDLSERTKFGIEYQHTAGADAVTAGLGRRL